MAKESVKFDYKTMSIKKMTDWILEHHKDDLKDFAKEANPQKNKENGEVKYSMKEAKTFFVNKYKDEVEIINIPKNGAKVSTYAILMNALNEN